LTWASDLDLADNIDSQSANRKPTGLANAGTARRFTRDWRVPRRIVLPRRGIRTPSESGDGTGHRQLLQAAARQPVVVAVAGHESPTLERVETGDDGPVRPSGNRSGSGRLTPCPFVRRVLRAAAQARAWATRFRASPHARRRRLQVRARLVSH